MNKQGENGISWTNVFGPGTGFTWNTITGCFHACQWNIGGFSAPCYARKTATRLKSDTFYPEGFETYTFHEGRLDEPIRRKRPAGIFAGSMADMFGDWVNHEHIEQVLDVCSQTPQHVYFILTKNPKRLLPFVSAFPRNIWVGVSAPPTFMKGKRMTAEGTVRYLSETRETMSYAASNGLITWMSVEPLWYDFALDARKHSLYQSVQWLVVGPATKGKQIYAPVPEWVERIEGDAYVHNIPLFWKNAMEHCEGWTNWKREYPTWGRLEAGAT